MLGTARPLLLKVRARLPIASGAFLSELEFLGLVEFLKWVRDAVGNIRDRRDY